MTGRTTPLRRVVEYAKCMENRKSAFLLSSGFVALLCCPQAAYNQAAPCTLLDQNQVSSVVGESVNAGSPIADTGCSWKGTGPSKVVVTVSMQPEKMFTGAKASVAPNTTKMTVSGIGDEAFFTGIQGFASLWVRKGTKVVLVRIYGLPVNEAQSKLRTLAATVVRKV